MFELPGATALVTGGARRLGRSTALALAKAGCNVIVHYHSSKDDAVDTVESIETCGVQAWPIEANLAHANEAKQLFETAVKVAGPIDYLINSASIFPEKRLDELSEESLLESFRINTLAPYVLSNLFYQQNRSGCIINYLDARMVDYDRKHVPYHLSKRTLFSVTRMMSIEYAPKVRVNGVAPGLILPPDGESDDYLDRLKHTNPMQTHGTPEQVAAAALFLAWNRFITGQVIFVDGGRHMKGSMYGA